MKFNLVDMEQVFVDSTHVKACANSKKMKKRAAHEQTLWYEGKLQKEIAKDREPYGKKPLKKKIGMNRRPVEKAMTIPPKKSRKK